jgi:hypothetical protein
MFKKILITLSLLYSIPAYANEIYITQSGDNLDLDIMQDGQDNKIGDSTTDMTLTGDTMTFDITQTGNFNEIDAIIKGNTYTGTWVFTGDTNTVDLTCDATSGVNCETVTLDITTTGDNNQFQMYIGENNDAENLVADFTITGDGNVIDLVQDGTEADITVTVDSSSSLASGTLTHSTTGLSTSAPGNYIDIDQTGNGDINGHSITLDITGGGGMYKISQSGIYDNLIDATFSGDGADVNITQQD